MIDVLQYIRIINKKAPSGVYKSGDGGSGVRAEDDQIALFLEYKVKVDHMHGKVIPADSKKYMSAVEKMYPPSASTSPSSNVSGKVRVAGKRKPVGLRSRYSDHEASTHASRGNAADKLVNILTQLLPSGEGTDGDEEAYKLGLDATTVWTLWVDTSSIAGGASTKPQDQCNQISASVRRQFWHPEGAWKAYTGGTAHTEHRTRTRVSQGNGQTRCLSSAIGSMSTSSWEAHP